MSSKCVPSIKPARVHGWLEILWNTCSTPGFDLLPELSLDNWIIIAFPLPKEIKSIFKSIKIAHGIITLIFKLNIGLISFGRGKASVFFSSPSALIRLYKCVQHRRQYLSKFISTYSKIVSLCQSFSAPSKLISNCLSLSVRTAQCVSLCQTFSVMAVQYQYLSKFVSEKRESKYFSDLVVLTSVFFAKIVVKSI